MHYSPADETLHLCTPYGPSGSESQSHPADTAVLGELVKSSDGRLSGALKDYPAEFCLTTLKTGRAAGGTAMLYVFFTLLSRKNQHIISNTFQHSAAPTEDSKVASLDLFLWISDFKEAERTLWHSRSYCRRPGVSGNKTCEVTDVDRD